MNLILASASPRRRELLAHFGLPFSVRSADVDETIRPELSPGQAAAELSAKKARATEAGPDDLIIAADTLVCIDSRILGKPHDAAHAAQMLRLLSGREHRVITGVTVRQGSRLLTDTETTQVWFRDLTDSEIAAYIACGEPMDKAGAYGIQGRAAAFIPRICGDYFNVMGLPLCLLDRLLHSFDLRLLEDTP